jgi:hypothetical protein
MPNSKNSKNKGPRRERRISVRGIRRETPDVRKLSRALLDLAIAQAEVEAQGQVEHDRAVVPDE